MQDQLIDSDREMRDGFQMMAPMSITIVTLSGCVVKRDEEGRGWEEKVGC